VRLGARSMQRLTYRLRLALEPECLENPTATAREDLQDGADSLRNTPAVCGFRGRASKHTPLFHTIPTIGANFLAMVSRVIFDASVSVPVRIVQFTLILLMICQHAVKPLGFLNSGNPAPQFHQLQGWNHASSFTNTSTIFSLFPFQGMAGGADWVPSRIPRRSEPSRVIPG
jgi:hypothetical protein